MIPATVTIDIPPEHAALVMRLVNRGIESRLPLTTEERAYASELSACLELLARMHRSAPAQKPPLHSAIY